LEKAEIMEAVKIEHQQSEVGGTYTPHEATVNGTNYPAQLPDNDRAVLALVRGKFYTLPLVVRHADRSWQFHSYGRWKCIENGTNYPAQLPDNDRAVLALVRGKFYTLPLVVRHADRSWQFHSYGRWKCIEITENVLSWAELPNEWAEEMNI
jgi:hypothetical protein